jgi:hypothetical protein
MSKDELNKTKIEALANEINNLKGNITKSRIEGVYLGPKGGDSDPSTAQKQRISEIGESKFEYGEKSQEPSSYDFPSGLPTQL